MDSAKVEVLHYYRDMNYAPNNTTFSIEPTATSASTGFNLSTRLFKKPRVVFDAKCCQVEQYCSMDPMSEEIKPLQWWKTHSNTFPNLSKMAKDILAIPGSSVPSERANSEAREMLPYTRNRLSPEVIEATLVAKSFLKGIQK